MPERNEDMTDGCDALEDWRNRETDTVAALVADMATDPWGQMSPSVYETARLVRTAPWLDGHDARCDFLLRSQRADGAWGALDGYDLVPTLSATEALLSEADRTGGSAERHAALAHAADMGLRTLLDRLGPGNRAAVPDTIAAEVIIPWLVEEINTELARRMDRYGTARLVLPPDADDAVLTRARAAATTGKPLPPKLWHSLEVLGAQAAGAPGVHPRSGAVGSSPAATAAWSAGGPVRTKDASATLLRRTQARNGGPVPGVISIAIFERAWVLGWLSGAGVPLRVSADLLSYLQQALGDTGAPAGPGLPPDSDDTAAVLTALALAGCPVPVRPLWAYREGIHFCCFPGEHTPSTSTNAHILEALESCLDPAEHERSLAAARMIVTWLLNVQNLDGSWDDKWHASPYYATMCCAVALARGQHTGTPAALRRARSWVLGSQRLDGSWGRWSGTTEETAYALRVLLCPIPGPVPHGMRTAVSRGAAFLLRHQDDDDFTPLWHDKDLYAPAAVIKAARIAALHSAADYLRHDAEQTVADGEPVAAG